MNYWDDAKRFIFHDIIVFSLCVLGFISLDVLHNLLFTLGFSESPHPYSMGLLQIGGIVFFSILLYISPS